MARDKSRDDKFFNCTDEHEVNYVVSLYEDRDGVRDLISKKCEDGKIHYSTNLEVYQLIKDELGYDIPVSY
tara:strand:+ start:6093 stop:6305 length:213 start_codon:yes stop_codon:yes gene_type:complete